VCVGSDLMRTSTTCFYFAISLDQYMDSGFVMVELCYGVFCFFIESFTTISSFKRNIKSSSVGYVSHMVILRLCDLE